MSSSAACAVVALSPARNELICCHERCDAAFRQITLTTYYYYKRILLDCHAVKKL